MQFKSIFHEFAHRIQQETPVFFKKIRATGLWLAGIGASLTSPELLAVKLPAALATVCGMGTHLVGIGTMMAIVASAACKKPIEEPATAPVA